MKFWFFIRIMFDYSDFNWNFLAIHYSEDIQLAFHKVNHISRDVNFGSLLGLCLIIQILTGIFLAIHYSGDIQLAFHKVYHIS